MDEITRLRIAGELALALVELAAILADLCERGGTPPPEVDDRTASVREMT